MQDIRSRENLYSYFDEYAAARKEELNKRSIKAGAGLIKSYALETNTSPEDGGLEYALETAGWRVHQIDTDLHRLEGLRSEMVAFIDVLTPRHLALYTTSPSTIADATVLSAVRRSVELDHSWFSSPILNFIWRQMTPTDTFRYATLRYESQPWFEMHVDYPHQEVPLEDEDEEYVEVSGEGTSLDEDVDRRQTARVEIRQRVRQLRNILPEEDEFGGLMGNLSRMRVPASNEKGRYDYFHYGKMTNRGQEFRGFRAHLDEIIGRLYGGLTRRIEELASFQVERQAIGDENGRLQVRGALVTYAFHRPLAPEVFSRFIDSTFERGQGPFRLWGSPIRLSGPRVHVYALDLHLWQQLYLDLTPHKFVLILPKGTCGNTVHRLLANIQRYLTPAVDLYVGDVPYHRLVDEALRTG